MFSIVPDINRLNVLPFDQDALFLVVGGNAVGIFRRQFNGLSRLGPVPEHEGRLVPGKGGDMAGLARNGVAMVIQGFEKRVIIVMGFFVVTIRAGHAPLADGGGGAGTRNFVINGHMTFLAGKILVAHVNILHSGGMFQGAVQIPVLDGIPAPAAPVARPAIGAGGKPDLLCDCRQIETLFFSAAVCGCFGVCPRSIVADQAVNVHGIPEIKIFVLPPVARVTAGAPAPVGDGGHSEIVDQCPLSQIRTVFVTLHIGAWTLPQPVGRMEHFIGLLPVAFEAVFRHRHAVRIGTFQGLMVFRNTRLGILGHCRADVDAKKAYQERYQTQSMFHWSSSRN